MRKKVLAIVVLIIGAFVAWMVTPPAIGFYDLGLVTTYTYNPNASESVVYTEASSEGAGLGLTLGRCEMIQDVNHCDYENYVFDDYLDLRKFLLIAPDILPQNDTQQSVSFTMRVFLVSRHDGRVADWVNWFVRNKRYAKRVERPPQSVPGHTTWH
jgi:hypothetical protein